MTPSRGRPRKFSKPDALATATGVFLKHGYDGASLDLLTTAMQIRKPSLYAAFGDKAALYDQVLDAYGEGAEQGMLAAIASGKRLEDGITALFDRAIGIYAPADGDALGCLIATTATTAAVDQPAVRARLADFLSRTDAAIAKVIAGRLRDEGRRCAIPAAALAAMITGTIHSLAVRARAGIPRSDLETMARQTARAIKVLLSDKPAAADR